MAAQPHFQRAFVSDHKILQRERKAGASRVLTIAAYSVVLGLALSILAALAAGLHRLAVSGGAAPWLSGRARRLPRRLHWQRTPVA